MAARNSTSLSERATEGDRFERWVEQVFTALQSATELSQSVEELSERFVGDAGLTSLYISWLDGRPRHGSFRRSRHRTRFERWLDEISGELADARARIADVLRAARRLQRRSTRRRRARPSSRALRTGVSEFTTVISGHGPPAVRLPLPVASRA